MSKAGSYKGLYFVLMGRLSPLEGVGPEKLAFSLLSRTVAEYAPAEVIIATNITAEGETTAEYVQQLLSPSGVKSLALRAGVPCGAANLNIWTREPLQQRLKIGAAPTKKRLMLGY